MPRTLRVSLLTAFACALLLLGCSDSGFGPLSYGPLTSPTGQHGQPATLEILLKDAPVEGLEALVITMESLELHHTGGPFFEALAGPRTFDLLQLRDRTLSIASLDLDPGRYTQIRIFVSEAIATVEGEERDVKVPSGKIKIIHPFELPEGATAVMIIDFDAEESLHLHETGNGQLILRPVIKIEGFEFDTGPTGP
jgi:hypothetical protein